MAGNGDPTQMHAQVRTSDRTVHPEACKIFGGPVETQAEPSQVMSNLTASLRRPFVAAK